MAGGMPRRPSWQGCSGQCPKARRDEASFRKSVTVAVELEDQIRRYEDLVERSAALRGYL